MGEEHKTSGILVQALKIEKTKKNDSSHFVLCNGDKIRYIIAPNGKKRLSKNISTYSGKLGLLMKYLNCIPFWMLVKAGIGYFAKIDLHPEIEKAFKQTGKSAWNMIIGTYDEKQKLVIQCFENDADDAVFIKIGNSATEKEMAAEMGFLRMAEVYRTFEIPQIIAAIKADDGNPFNLQLTRDFKGEKVEPVLTEDIVDIYKEISAIKHEDDAIPNGYAFSHGDFAPWNIKKTGNGYTVFDWEHCGIRLSGFDLMHYVVVSAIMINGIQEHDAFKQGLETIRNYINDYDLDEQDFFAEYHRLRLEE